MSHLNCAAGFVIVAVVASMLGFADVSETSVWVAAVFLSNNLIPRCAEMPAPDLVPDRASMLGAV